MKRSTAAIFCAKIKNSKRQNFKNMNKKKSAGRRNQKAQPFVPPQALTELLSIINMEVLRLSLRSKGIGPKMVQKATGSRRTAMRKSKGRANGTAKAHSSSCSSSAGGHHGKRYMGVRQSPSGRWVAEIKATAQKIRLWLGTFDTAEMAARAYDEAACLLRGANTRTNFWPRSPELEQSPSVLPDKVLAHLLVHLGIRRGGQVRPRLSLPQLPFPMPPLPRQLKFDDRAEIEPIARMAYTELPSDASVSGSSYSGEENEFGMRNSNRSMGVGFHDLEGERGEQEVDMHLRTLEEQLSCFYEPSEMGTKMEEKASKPEMGAYDYWLMLSTAEKIF